MSREIGIRLFTLRNIHEWTQTEVARRLSIDRSAYGYYELGKTEPPLRTVKQLTEIYGVEYEELIDPLLSEREIMDYEVYHEQRKR